MSNTSADSGTISGSVRSEDGTGVVRLECRYAAAVEEVWSAITEPARLAAWHAKVEGDLRVGGEIRIVVERDEWEGTGRVDACEPPRHLAVTSRESDASWQSGQGAPPFDEVTDATLTPAGDETVLVVEVKGLPLDKVQFYGAGWQLHAENLEAYLAGRGPVDARVRWEQILPLYEAQAANLS